MIDDARNRAQVSVEATYEHPFFVIGQGWSSHDPERTRLLYGLPCQRLTVGDVCISLTHRDTDYRAQQEISGAATAATGDAEMAAIANIGTNIGAHTTTPVDAGRPRGESSASTTETSSTSTSPPQSASKQAQLFSSSAGKTESKSTTSGDDDDDPDGRSAKRSKRVTSSTS